MSRKGSTPGRSASNSGTRASVGSKDTTKTQISWAKSLTGYEPGPFDRLLEIDMMFKEEMIAALEEKWERLGEKHSALVSARSPQSPTSPRKVARKLARMYADDPGSVEANNDMKMLGELDARLESYYQALIRNRDICNPEWMAGNPDNQFSSRSDSTNNGNRGENGFPRDRIAVNSMTKPKMPEPQVPSRRSIPSLWNLLLSSFFTVLFLIGGMTGLYCEIDRLRRLALVIVLVILLILFLVWKRVRPKDVFLMAAAYAAVLVVFLSGDLAGPQDVVIQSVSGDAGLVTLVGGSVHPATASATSEASVASGMGVSSTESIIGSTLLTVVKSNTAESTTLTASAATTVGSATDDITQTSGTPTGTALPYATEPPGFWKSPAVAGFFVPVGVVVLMLIGLSYECWRRRRAA
ncbi:hypothetical protein GQ53DRAFT_821501 [Thozetella sp. PMI_491]|nr:hypothetical protein GQ53DRAFT_821501 [Thozetella sp. PMI_491]